MAANGKQTIDQQQDKKLECLNPNTRPESILRAIDYNERQAETLLGMYVFTGDTPYYCSTGKSVLDVTGRLPPQINIEKLISILSRRIHASEGQFDLLDIGTARGGILSHYREQFNINAIGISLHKYRDEDENYIVGDAHNLDKLLRADQKFDLILGFKVYMHMVDPWGALISAYSRLKPNGFLIADAIPLRSNIQVGFILNFLKENGVELYANNTFFSNELNVLILKKTTESLRLPLNYQGELIEKSFAEYKSTITYNSQYSTEPYNPPNSAGAIAESLYALFNINSGNIFDDVRLSKTFSKTKNMEQKISATPFWEPAEQELLERLHDRIMKIFVEKEFELKEDSLMYKILHQHNSIKEMLEMAIQYKDENFDVNGIERALYLALRYNYSEENFGDINKIINDFEQYIGKIYDQPKHSSEQSCCLM